MVFQSSPRDLEGPASNDFWVPDHGDNILLDYQDVRRIMTFKRKFRRGVLRKKAKGIMRNFMKSTRPKGGEVGFGRMLRRTMAWAAINVQLQKSNKK